MAQNPSSEYVGKYTSGSTRIVYVQIRYGKLTLRPIFWHSFQRLAEVQTDSFVVDDRPQRGATFSRDAKGKILALTLVGFGRDDGLYKKSDDTRPLSLELLFVGMGKEAFRALADEKENNYASLLKIGTEFFERYPSKAGSAADYFKAFANIFSDSSQTHTLLGRAYIAVKQRAQALESFRIAFSLDPNNQDAKNYLLRLHALPVPPELTAKQWNPPFSLDELFKKPSRSEIETVRKLWSNRDLSVLNVQEVMQKTVRFGTTDMVVRIVAHRVHGFLHYGAILIPPNAAEQSCPVIVEAKGVSWNYSPLNVNQGLVVPDILGDDLSKFIVVVPSFRGETLQFNGQEFLSEGDRTDSWDGATDDALALLNVALHITPQADSTRIGVFGKSRGGSVALLAGIRDKRIVSVVDWTGPTDWFNLMGYEGWTQQELVEEGLRIQAKPNETAGQFIERYLLKAVQGTATLAEVRLHMIAGSPLYFAHLLPRLQIHYGVEDYNVPFINGKALAETLQRLGRNKPVFSFYTYDNFGHDLDVPAAIQKTHPFLLDLLKKSK